MQFQTGISVLSGVLIALSFFNWGADACFVIFKNEKNVSFVQQDCAKSAGFATHPTSDQLSKEEFDDKCISKCVINGLQMIDNEGQIDKDVLLDFLEINAPESYLLKLSELATTCVESSGADKIETASKTGKTSAECEPLKQFYSCFLQGAEKLC